MLQAPCWERLSTLAKLLAFMFRSTACKVGRACNCLVMPLIRTFRAAVDLSWRQLTVDLNRLTQTGHCAPNLSHFGGLREVLVTCNAGRQPVYWKSARTPQCS